MAGSFSKQDGFRIIFYQEIGWYFSKPAYYEIRLISKVLRCLSSIFTDEHDAFFHYVTDWYSSNAVLMFNIRILRSLKMLHVYW